MIRFAITLSLALLIGPDPVPAQGVDTPTSATTPGSVENGVLIGAGTTDETTTGSSGPQAVPTETVEDLPESSEPAAAATGSVCDRIRDETARNICNQR